MKSKSLSVAVLCIFFMNSLLHAQTSAVVTASSTAATRDVAKEERNKQTALAWMRAFFAGDKDTYVNSFDKTAIFHYANGYTETISLDSLRVNTAKEWPIFRKGFPDLAGTVLSAATDNNYVIMWVEATGTWKGEMQRKKPGGKSFTLRTGAVLLFNEAGKITEETDLTDNFLDLAQQVGLIDSAEFHISVAAHRLLDQKKTAEAMELFTLNLKHYPDDWHVYQDFGDVYEATGDKKKAVENYEKSLSLFPENEYLTKKLAKLKGK